MLEKNNIYNMDCLEGIKLLDDNSVDLTVTSPPYDNLRTYGDTCEWNFDIFKEIAQELYRVTRKGGVIVWVVGDACLDGSETGSSFRQALYFKDLGMKLHDTMIYEKNSSTFPAKANSKRYSQIFEYMFVFTKGKIRNDIKLIADKKNKWAGWSNWGTKMDKSIKPVPEFSLRNNLWKYNVGFNDKTGHPAVFPEKLAEDHILSWSVEGDLVLDPFMGSGTTAKAAMLTKRNFLGFEKNKDYCDVAIARVKKYQEAARKETLSVTELMGETLQYESNDESDMAEKIVIYNNLLQELNDYMNTQSATSLKSLTFAFKSKSNDAKIERLKAAKII